MGISRCTECERFGDSKVDAEGQWDQHDYTCSSCLARNEPCDGEAEALSQEVNPAAGPYPLRLTSCSSGFGRSPQGPTGGPEQRKETI
jgi:hypothetical protein